MNQVRPSKDIGELFCLAPNDQSPLAVEARKNFKCLILGTRCTKNNDAKTGNSLLDGPLGVCSVVNPSAGETVICPNRLYADNYRSIHDMALSLFNLTSENIASYLFDDWVNSNKPLPAIVLLGKNSHGEISTPVGHIDWTAVLLDKDGEVKRIAWIEVQAIDTTGNYRETREAYLNFKSSVPKSKHGLNWENVNKRIIPQLIRKGTYLLQAPSQLSPRLGFLVDANVFKKFQARLGDNLPCLKPKDREANLLIRSMKIGNLKVSGNIRPLVDDQTIWTSVDGLVKAFQTPPPMQINIVEEINKILQSDFS